jgi:hypothetical protein
MKKFLKYDTFITGFAPGIILPFATALLSFLFASRGETVFDFYFRILKAGFVTHGMTLCMVPDVILFFVFTRLDMLKSAKGMLAATIIWVLFIVIYKIF